ncbi:phosphotransferase family protein [Granulosicoccus sp. 3-233]|uniref:phosphotransferase family protein n=1 Tax=Granulosicoccus sp. 3-233 TaxID=3417969 RepID=UPI003D346384
MPEFERRCRSLLSSLGLCQPEDIHTIRRLSGGVASDIAAVSFAEQTVCVKFALEKLKVQEDWFAPEHRGKAEFAWLQAAGRIVPDAVPMLHGWSDADNGFAMEFLDHPDIRLWKTELLNGCEDTGEATAVADTLGRIHAASTSDGFDHSPFDNSADFESLRLEPYLRFTARQHPDIAATLNALADQLAASRQVLIHGDVSPKNILLRNDKPVILDAECATMGDPCFDVAFALNHLLLKSFHLPQCRSKLRQAARRFWAQYAPHICWEDARYLESRTVRLLPALMLARIDGKSPVEYLDDDRQRQVRQCALALIRHPTDTLTQFLESEPMNTRP